VSVLAPRVVLVTRQTDYEALLARHATRQQAAFFLEQRGEDIGKVQHRHERFSSALAEVRRAIPLDWRVSSLQREDLDRFLFAEDDIVLAVGQDGLVANVAKYLSGQPVLGINPEPGINPGILVPLTPEAVPDLLRLSAGGRAKLEARTMAEASLEDGQTLLALNELFIGHRSHQSARYVIEVAGADEQQSSSGVIVSTGTGMSGWSRSILLGRSATLDVAATEASLAYFVREAWPSPATGTSLSMGKLAGRGALAIASRMQEGGVIFADGIETDYLAFDWGRKVTVSVAAKRLNLVVG